MLRTPPRRRTADPETDRSLELYLESIRAYHPLPLDEERELGARIRAGDREAADALVCANLRFVVSVARKYRGQGLSLGDLIDEGNLGLIRAAHKFDERRGVRFISYAVWWIRQAIHRALAEQGRVLRVPVNRAGTLYRIGRRAAALGQELGREATRAEIAQRMGISEQEVARSLAMARPPLSLDAPVAPGEETELRDRLPDLAREAPDAATLDEALRDGIAEALAGVSDREARILRLYFGLDGSEPMTLDEIGRILGITRERVRQLRERALGRIRRGEAGQALRAWQGAPAETA